MSHSGAQRLTSSSELAAPVSSVEPAVLVYDLTEEEEAVLLAEYGVVGAYDDLLCLPAASKFKSELDGGVNVFLTGAAGGDGGQDEDGSAASRALAAALPEELLYNPIEALLLKYTSGMDRGAPNSLLDDLSGLHRATSQVRREEEEGNDRFHRVLAAARSEGDRAFRRVCGWTTGGRSLADLSTDSVLDEATALLRRCEAVMAAPTVVDPLTDELLRQRLAHVEELIGLDEAPVGSEGDDAESLVVLRRAADLGVKLRHAVATADSDTPANRTDPQTAELPPFTEELAEEPTLFAFDFVPTREEAEATRAWDTIAVNDTAAGPLTFPASKPREHLAPGDLLARLRNFEAEQERGTEVINERFAARFANARLRDSECRPMEHESTGVQVLAPFASAIERLLPALVSSTPRLECSAEALREAALEKPRLALPAKDQASSVVEIQRQAALHLRMMELEAIEARAMRHEDARMTRAVAHADAAVARIAELIAKAQARREDEHSALAREESAAFTALMDRRQRHLDLMARAVSIREMKAAAALAEAITAEYDGVSRELAAEEATERNSLRTALGAGCGVAAERAAARLSAEQRRAIEDETARRRAFTAHHVKLHVYSAAQPSATAPRGAAMSRREVLALELDAVTSWTLKNSKGLGETVAALTEEIRRCTEELQPRRARFHSDATTQSPVPEDASPGILSATSMKRLISRQLAAAARDPARAARYFDAVSLALDDLSGIEYTSVRSLHVDPADPAVAALAVAPLVRTLNLGSNQLRGVSVPALLWVFPSLRDLDLSDNQLRTLDDRGARVPEQAFSPAGRSGSMTSAAALRGVAAARQNTLAQRCTLESLNLSSNILSDLDAVGEWLPASLKHLTAVANKLTSLASLQRCQRLATLDLTRNAVSSLDHLQSLSLLQEVNVCDNRISSFGEEIPRHNMLLTKAYLSSNPTLSHIAGGGECLLFLRQLFLNDCAVESVTTDTFPWMPSLSILHMQGNRITDISGLVKCPRLTNLNVAFNRLPDVAALAPLGVCEGISTLDLRENPLMKVGAVSSAAPLAETVRLLPRLAELNGEPVPTGTSAAMSGRLLAAFPPSTSDMAALLMDSLQCDERTLRDVTHIFGVRRIRSAEALEDKLSIRARDRDALAVGCVTSTEARHRQHVLTLAHLLSTLRRVADVARAEGSSAAANRHFVNPIYAERERGMKEQWARGRLVDFLCGVALCRRAKAELAVLRVARTKTDGYRREMAARRIQPVWRGAVIRSRLSRILGRNNDGDDDDEFQKVDMDFDAAAAAALQPATVADLLMQAVSAGRATAVNGELFPRFNVPATVVNPLSTPGLQFVPSEAVSFSASDSLKTVRPGTSPEGASVPPDAQCQNRPGSDGASNRPLAPHPPRVGAPMPATVDSAWGAGVAAQIQKKNRKLQRVHQEYTRREFVLDPLHAKRLAGSVSKAPAK